MEECKDIESLKYAIFDEWSCDPPGGTCTWFYAAYGAEYGDIMWPIDEMSDHVSEAVNDDDADELKEAVDSVQATGESIKKFYFDNGGVGCDCMLLAEGKDIAEKAGKFLEERLDEFFFDDDEEKLQQKQEIIDQARKEPRNLEKVQKLIDLIDEGMEAYNDNNY